MVAVCAEIEGELSEMDEDDRIEIFMAEMGLEEPGLKPRDQLRLWLIKFTNLFYCGR